mmetsp:Transcript_10672/g.25688  ORF Transcript_10672/g.25688 Transcript_10672/m.25688 type:complete len:126 (+) Transcript_10672:811-1188(+)
MTFTQSFLEKTIWIDLDSLLDMREKRKDTRKALAHMLKIIWTVMAACNPRQSDLKKPLALPGKPYPTVVQVSSEKAYAALKLIGFPGSPKPQSMLRLWFDPSTYTKSHANIQIARYQTPIMVVKE